MPANGRRDLIRRLKVKSHCWYRTLLLFWRHDWLLSANFLPTCECIHFAVGAEWTQTL